MLHFKRLMYHCHDLDMKPEPYYMRINTVNEFPTYFYVKLLIDNPSPGHKDYDI